MYAQAKEIDKEFMSDRTTGGLMTELEVHYVAYKNNILPKRLIKRIWEERVLMVTISFLKHFGLLD